MNHLFISPAKRGYTKGMDRRIICALDTGDLDEAIALVHRFAPYVGAFKIGHGLTMPNGLRVVDILREHGAERIFLDLKFHDIPNSVALAVREAANHGVWMLTLHLSGGPAMISAAVEEAAMYPEEQSPLLVGVSVLTSLDEATLQGFMGVNRTLPEQMAHLSQRGVELGLDGVVCSAHELKVLRPIVGNKVLVTPGIRGSVGDVHDQVRVGDAQTALADSADYLVIGRALTSKSDPVAALQQLGLDPVGA